MDERISEPGSDGRSGRDSQLEVYDGTLPLATRVTELFLDSMESAVRANGSFSFALSGGRAPHDSYVEIARRSSRNSLWGATHAFWGDERCVPPQDTRSNELLARDSLLARVPIPSYQIHPMRCTGDADEAALRYGDLLREHFGLLPKFDLVFLGLGEDGHTASLFAGSPLLETKDWVAVAKREDEEFKRLTLTLPVINRAARVVFVVSGKGKADALRRALAGDRGIPGGRVQPESGRLHWLVDTDAASRLGSR